MRMLDDSSPKPITQLSHLEFRDARGGGVMRTSNLSDLVGQIVLSVTRCEIKGDDDGILFRMKDGREYALVHQQDCCEEVVIDDITGDLGDLVGTPITSAERVSNPEFEDGENEDGSYTWTFFKLATIKNYVDVRFYGRSNGYYSEEADLYELT